MIPTTGTGGLLGEARVEVRADLSKLVSGFAIAERETRAFSTRTAQTSLAATTAFAALSKQSKSLGEAIRAIDGPLGGVSSRLASATALVRTTGPVLAAMALGFGAVTIATKGWVDATIDAEDTLVLLRNALKATGRDAELSATQMADFSSQLQKTTAFEDEAITRVQTRLVTFQNISADVFPRATRAILDFAEATKKDLGSAADSVGIALQNPAEALQRLNRTERIFTSGQADAIEQLDRLGKHAEANAAILAGLEARYKGAADAARNTLGGALKALGNSIQDMTEVSGGSLGTLTGAVNFLNTNLEETVDDIKIAGAAGATILVARFFGPMTQAALAAAAAELAFQASVAKGTVVALGSARALEQKAGAEVAATAATLEAAKAETAYAASEVRSLALNREMIAAELALADARLRSTNAMRVSIPGIGGRAQSDETNRMADLQRQNAAMTALQTNAEVQLGIAQAKEAEIARAAGVAQTVHAAALTRAALAGRVAAGAMTTLRAVTAFFGGPVGLAITAAAAGFYLLSRNSGDATEKVDDFAGSMGALNAILDTAEQHLERIGKEERDRARQLTEATLATERATLAEKERHIALLETARTMAQGMGIQSDVEGATKQLAIQRAEVEKLRDQVGQLADKLKSLNAIPPPKPRTDTGQTVDAETLKRRRDTIKGLQDETGSLDRLLPLYRSQKISLEDLNAALQGEKVLSDLLLTSHDAEGKKILDLIAKRTKQNQVIETTTTLREAEADLSVSSKQIPLLLATGQAQDKVNSELQFQIGLERELIKLGLVRGSDDATRLEKDRRNQKIKDDGLDDEFKRREALGAAEDQVSGLLDEAEAFGKTSQAAAEAAKRIELLAEVGKDIHLTADEVDRLAKAFGEAVGQRELTGLLDDLRQGLKDTTREMMVSQQTIGATTKQTAAFTYEQEQLAIATKKVEKVSPEAAAEIHRLALAFGEAQANIQVSQLLGGLTQNVRSLQTETTILAGSFGKTAGEAAAFRFQQEALAEVMRLTGEVSAENASKIADMAAAYGAATDRASKLAGRQEAMQAVSSELSGIFSEMRRGTLSLGDAFARLADSIADAVMQAALFGQGPLAGLFGNQGTGGLIGGGIGALLGLVGGGGAVAAGSAAISDFGDVAFAASTAVAHSGLRAYQPPGMRRSVPASAFIGAPRLHDGLRQNEFTAILEKGEEVTPKGKSRNRRGGDTFIMNNNGVTDFDSYKQSESQAYSKFADTAFVAKRRNG